MENKIRLVDLSHLVESGMPRFSQAVPAPVIHPWKSHSETAASGVYEGCSCELTEVSMLTSLGTYLDSPFHFHPEMESIEDLDLERLVLPGRVLDCTGLGGGREIGPEILEGRDVAGKAVLLRTDWSRYWGEEEYFNYPFVGRELALALVRAKAALVGIDTMVMDSTADPTRPAHVNLLGAGVLIVENLTNLLRLPEDGFVFSAAPVKAKNAASFPVRAYAMLEGDES